MSKFKTITESILNEAMSRLDLRAEVYNNVFDTTKKMYKDEYWAGYTAILNKLKEIGFEIISAPANDELHRNGYSSDGKEKAWSVELTKDGKTLHGSIKAHAAGTIENPFEMYDLTIELW